MRKRTQLITCKECASREELLDFLWVLEQKYNLIVDYYEDASNIEESFPCCLLLHLQFNAKESAKITDFSNYENSNIIGYSVLSKGPPPPGYANQLEEDGSIRMLIRNVQVNKYKDGEYFWELM